MPLSHLPCNIIVGSVLLLLVACETSGPDLVHLSASPDVLPAPESRVLAEGGKKAPPDPEEPAVMTFLGGTQESGFSSEEAEEPKAVQSQLFWDEGGEVNGTSLDPDPTEGDSTGGLQPSSLALSLLGEVPGDLNSSSSSSSSLVPVGESLDPDLWEIQGEMSGSPAEAAYDPPVTDTAPLTNAPTTDSDSDPDAGLALRWDGGDARGTLPPHEEGVAEQEEGGLTHAEVSAHATTIAGVAEDSPTDEAEVVDTPSVLTAVAGGVAEFSPTDETEGVDTPSVLTGVVGVAEFSPTDETEGVDTPSVLTTVAGGVAELSPTDEAETVQQGETAGEPGDWDHHTPLTTVPSSSPSSSSFPRTAAFTDIPWHRAAPTHPQGPEQKPRQGSTQLSSEPDFLEKHPAPDALQVVCVDWSDLTGKGYVILNMSENFDCDEFRVESGDQLLEMLETAFSRKMNSPQGSWVISLSKPSRQDRQLLMTLASEQGVIATKDVLSMLGEIRRGLHDIGIQNYTSVSSCQSRPSQMRSDYGKLFVVLVIIGSVCVVIIASGLIYICWQRRLPKMKNMSRGEELHFVENGCHDNPTLDVASDNQSEMLEKKPSANGVVAGGGGGSGWQVLVNKPGKEEAENVEEDTHL